MKILLAIVPILALMAGMGLYRHDGRREILRFDLVHFFYAFVLLPVIYVWFKSFLFYFLEAQHAQTISPSAFLFWDSVYSIIFLFLYAFMVIHSLTKSFRLRQEKDPLYDLFEHSEYYHLWVTHTIIVIAAMVISLLLAALNAWLDLPWLITLWQFYGILMAGLFTAGLIFKVFLISDFGDWRFVKLMKLVSGIFLILHVVIYAIFEPSFSGEKSMFWFQFSIFFGLSMVGLLHESQPVQLPIHHRIGRKFGWLGRKIISEMKKFSGRFRK
jgi:hypothetical protein